jgi:UDP-glucose 4-epimerase
MKVVVTGGAGFIGSNIADLLIQKEYEVVIIDNLSHGKKENINAKAKFYQCDIKDSKIIDIFQKEKPQVLIHEAAQISVPNSINDPINDASINIIGTLNLLEACRKTGVKRVIYPASAAIFGEPEYLPIDEKHPLNMLSGYGVTKHTVEHYLRVYKSLYDINYVVLRYANVYGPRQDSSGEGGVVAIFSEKLINNETPYIYGDGEQIRDFVYVKDVAKANLMAMTSGDNEIFNVCTNYKVSVNDLLRVINSALGREIKAVYTDERPGDIRNSYMNYDKIKNALGWIPDYDFEAGIRETIEYYKSLK